MARQNNGIDRIATSFRGGCALASRFHDQEGQAVAQDNTTLLVCDADLVQSGFYPAEQSQDGTTFRWLGPAPLATVFLPPLAIPLEIRLHIHSAFLPDVLEDVRMALDGGDWAPVVVREEQGGTQLCACPRPGPMAHLGTLRLDIDTVRTESPRQRGQMDDRSLSLALSAITLRPLA
jgi:hypothetical protein